MLSLISRTRYEAERARLVTELDTVLSERIMAAKSLGDLSENSEYEAAVSDANQARIRLSEIDELLDSSHSNMVYGSTIGIGSFITVVYKFEDGSISDLGLFMFDSVGSAVERIISPQSELGHRIQGTAGGDFSIKIDGGKTAVVNVTLEPESKMQEYLDMFPPGSVTFEDLLEEG